MQETPLNFGLGGNKGQGRFGRGWGEGKPYQLGFLLVLVSTLVEGREAQNLVRYNSKQEAKHQLGVKGGGEGKTATLG